MKKKLFSLLLIAVMVLSSFATVFAAEITVKTGDNHEYDVYQIFTGDISGGKLINVKWGKNGTGEEGTAVPQTTLDAIAAVSGTETEMAATLKTYADMTTPYNTVAVTATAPLKNLPSGYYLIKDRATTLPAGDEFSLYIVKVLDENVEIVRKAGTTTSDKKLDDVNDSTGAEEKLQTSSDYDIGDWVPYHLTATVSEKVGQFKTYKMNFKDTLQKDKFDAIELKAENIKINGSAVADTADYTVQMTGVDAATKDGFVVSFVFVPKEGKTLGSLAGAEITIDFKAQLGVGANIGSAGNKNTFILEYSNNPNADDGGTPVEDTPKVVITFTYKVVVDKVDQNNKPLPNAGFVLYKVSKENAEAVKTGGAQNATYAAKDWAGKNAYWADKFLTVDGKAMKWEEAAGAEKTSFTFNGIDDGFYVLCEKTVPEGYNPIDPMVFEVTGTHGGEDGLTLTDLNGNKVSGEISFTENVENGTLSATIKNQQGSTLPQTGGMGTTIIYILGAALVIGAGVVLVSRKKVDNR